LASTEGGFPESAWESGLFAHYRELVGRTTEAPDAFLWGALAGALSFLIGQDATCPWGASFQPATLLIALVGTTGKARKSTAIDDVLHMVVEPLRARASGREPDPTDVVVGSGSGEGFAAALADKRFSLEDDDKGTSRMQTGRRVLFVIHELGALLGKVERGQAGNMMDFLLGCFDARPKWTHRTRNADDEIHMTRASGVVLAASTATWLVDQLSDMHVMAGFANRFLWLAGDRKEPVAFRPRIAPLAQQAFQERVRDALNGVGTGSFELDAEAMRLHSGFYDLQYRVESDDALQDAAIARMDILALRIALVLAAGDGTSQVRAHHVSAAWQVAEYSCRVVADLVQRIRVRTLREAEDRVLRAAARVAAATQGEFSKRDVYQRVKGKSGLDSATFNQLWNSLLSVEAIEPVDQQGRRFRVAP
jgi:hypothetical protein